MKIGTMSKGVALFAAATIALAACTSDAGTEDENSTSPTADATATASGTKDDTVFVSVGEDEWDGYNDLTPATYSTYNSVINERVRQTFVYFDENSAIQINEEFGNVELISEDPMVVEYTINEDAVWSDGEPIKYEDVLLTWAAQKFTDGEDADGNPVALFDHVGGLDYGERVLEGPQGEAGGKSFTVEYENPFPDYMLTTVVDFPAHIAAEQAGVSLEDLVTAIQGGDVEALRPVAEFWNTGWLSPSAGELPDPAIALSSGPYTYGSWEAGQSLTLVPNENYWGTPPATANLVFRFASADTHVQALQNGDLNVIEPQATIDTLDQLAAIGDAVTVGTFDTLIWEHLDFNFGEGGSLADSLELREAFALCVPRQLIVDNLIAPVNPEAQIMNAREVFPFEADYDTIVSAAYDGRYDTVDIEAAAAKIEEAGVDTPVQVRIGYNTPNPRRTDVAALIKDSCDQAGFEIVDSGSSEFFSADLPSGNFDVAMYAWSGSGQIASGQNIYASDGAQNYTAYANDTVDAAWDTLTATLDTEAQQEQTIIIEKELWDSLFGIPLFAHPGVAAWDSTIQNVAPTASQSAIVWNAEKWVR
ncbi:ABC transporter substrate-binding protein [Demequina sp. B12]|uniref:ABC transporter substrate-binding protein n=1 Tax=Demequina sp. B12 TaxID=2992757 RepID=UPI00237C129C|nr:ABC transporter substrate-binding protein [Demequina sp. B12]MDE0572598.1 ABC transporter substrate-binding protein [Demequina sp. B12]